MMWNEYSWHIISITILLLMLFGNRKVRVYNVFFEQLKVFRNAKTSKICLWDITCFIVFPIILSCVIVLKFSLCINSSLAGVLTTIFSLVFTILFGFVAILVGRIDSERKIERQVVGETFVSIVSSMLLALMSTILSIILVLIDESVLTVVLSIIIYFFSFVIVMLLLMIMKRTFIIYTEFTRNR